MNPVPGEGKPRGISIFGNNPELEIIMPKRDLSAYLIGLSQVFLKSSHILLPLSPHFLPSVCEGDSGVPGSWNPTEICDSVCGHCLCCYYWQVSPFMAQRPEGCLYYFFKSRIILLNLPLVRDEL